MEFVEEESRPRFLLQSHPPSSSSTPETLKPNKLHLLLCFSSASILLFLTFSFLLPFQTLSFLLIWTSLSLLIAPFTPSHVTAGDPRVGQGPPLPDPTPDDEPSDRLPSRRPRSRRPENPNPNPNPPSPITRSQDPPPIRKSEPDPDPIEESTEWTAEDFEILKKQISKHPVGEPQRWEKITEGFNGRRRLESVIKMGKSMAERRPDDKDSFAQFLRQRKPLDKRVDENLEENLSWSSNEDIALLNALKAFPKETAMRWEKVAAAVPGRTKGECVKRVSELKKDFRSSKASEA